MSIRGVRKPGAMTITSSMRGGFLDNPMTRNELMAPVFESSWARGVSSHDCL